MAPLWQTLMQSLVWCIWEFCCSVKLSHSLTTGRQLLTCLNQWQPALNLGCPTLWLGGDIFYSKCLWGDEEMMQCLRVLPALPDDPKFTSHHPHGAKLTTRTKYTGMLGGSNTGFRHVGRDLCALCIQMLCWRSGCSQDVGNVKHLLSQWCVKFVFHHL